MWYNLCLKKRDYLQDYSVIRVCGADEGENAVLGAFPYYTPQDLIRKGKRFVGDHTLSAEEKRKYGVE